MKTSYDYQTKFFPNQTHVPFDEDKKHVGPEWKRVWADTTMTGTFVVYRKEIQVKENPLDRFRFCDEKNA